ncbi:MAG: ISNCY family transposase [Anaerovoracaceae bacterium]
MNEQQKYDIIKSLVDHKGNKTRAALTLGCTVRHVNRLIAKYHAAGKEAFVHGNRNHKPAHALTAAMKADIVNLYSNKYCDATFAHASELLTKYDEITISPTTLAKIMYDYGVISPRTKKSTKKKLREKLKIEKEQTSSKKKKAAMEAELIALEDAHPRRPRCAFFGEMLQMDASLHQWIPGFKMQLHIAIDDASGHILGAYFDRQETLNGYYQVFSQILSNYGIPAMFYTDNRTVFEYKRKQSGKVELDTFTQFGYACKQLGVELKTTSIPQAKGRVERAFQTLQQRLPIELRLRGITTLEDANVFLNSYIKEYNLKFGLSINHIPSVFETQPSNEKINQILAVITERTIDAGHCIKFNHQYYKLINGNGILTCFHKGTKATVITTFDQQLLCCVHNEMYVLDVLEKSERFSRNFDYGKKEVPTKRTIPDAGHPWRNSNFLKFRNSKLTEEMLTA